ncbi:sodium-independent anion transporter [Psychrobacter sp. YP14]|uniref:STAS domain-containing protein n=2 Tax=Psychrobacter TaxID=497 RepID=A0A844LY90_9GAMM|nr:MULTISPECIES: SulP family inorganic anion transporter [Psychrobacter]AWT48231.1 sodium-independent anion transporter [Psychrobacter sp. YP14]MUG31641.1 STAS domain-containing protein [Psychrobacter sanguinis]
MTVLSINTLRDEWFSNVRGDVLSGLVVALALIPEAIAFSIIAGVDPKVGLYASFCIAVVISFVGGRPGMISAATGAMALVMVTLVADHGLQYLLAATLLCGVIQFFMGVFKLGNLMRFVSRSVVIGFVNALAILIFMAQLPELNPAVDRVGLPVYIMTAAGLAIIYGFPLIPKIGKLIPSPLICIVGLTAVALYMGLDIRNVGDMGELPDTLPMFLLPDIPLTLDTLLIIAPYSIALAIVGLLESMMTATIVDDLTDTTSDKNRECRGQGIANVASGFFGGMAGCAMIGQSVINVKSGGRTRLSTFIAGVVLLIMVVFLSDWVSQIPMAALVAVMIMVSIGTFNWESLREFKTHPVSFNVVMVATVITTVFTHNLAYGVLVGVLLSALFFANKIGQFLSVLSEYDETNNTRYYYVHGQVFFSSTTQFLDSFDTKEALDQVVIDVSQAHFWDVTAVDTLDKLVIRFQREGIDVKVVGLNSASRTLIDKFSVHDRRDIGLLD